jgi:hypothetical protein
VSAGVYDLVPIHDTHRARWARRFHPAYSWCGRCGMPWSAVRLHATRFTASEGIFVLCEGCWSALTPVERWPYYAQLLVWQGATAAKGAAVLAAVEAGR